MGPVYTVYVSIIFAFLVTVVSSAYLLTYVCAALPAGFDSCSDNLIIRQATVDIMLVQSAFFSRFGSALR